MASSEGIAGDGSGQSTCGVRVERADDRISTACRRGRLARPGLPLTTIIEPDSLTLVKPLAFTGFASLSHNLHLPCASSQFVGIGGIYRRLSSCRWRQIERVTSYQEHRSL